MPNAKLIFLLAVAAVSIPGLAQQATPPATTGPTPEIFAPGVISGPGNDGTPSFSSDGNTLLFTRSNSRWSIILESHRSGATWTSPAVAAFSGDWPDSSPAFSPDGSYVIYVSVRRVPASPVPGVPSQSTSHIWRVNRTSTGWGVPTELPDAVNAFSGIYRPSVASDGSIYFTSLGAGKELSLFRSMFRDGAYEKAEQLPFSDGSIKDVDPEIAPDQSFMIFSSRRPFPGENNHEHLFIARNLNGHWGEIEPIRYNGDIANGSSDDNDPRLGPDRRTIYFSSDRAVLVHFPRKHESAVKDWQRMEQWDNGNTNVWMVPLKAQ